VKLSFNNVFKFERNFNLSALWTYHTGQPYTPADVQLVGESTRNGDGIIFFDVDDKNSGWFPDYHTLNLKIDKSWILKKVEIKAYLNIVNLYNRANLRNYTFDGKSNVDGTGIEVFRDDIEYFIRFTPGISVKF